MSEIQTKNGKAFEYACLQALYSSLSDTQPVSAPASRQLETAEKFYEKTPLALKEKLLKAGMAAARALTLLEPQLSQPGKNTPLLLSLQTDAAGQYGDVRDILCQRSQNNWEIGISCKHNHHAVKHSRLSYTIDFGADWFGIQCSQKYTGALHLPFAELANLRALSGGRALWADVENKIERFYVPTLTAFMNELARLDSENPEQIPGLLVRYLIGKHDFYKVIADDAHSATRIEGVNLYGTLNRASEKKRSITSVARLRLPTKFYHIGFKEGSNTTIDVVCDEGWAFSMRIHNASSKVEPSLKFDINLVSLPNTIYAQIEPW